MEENIIQINGGITINANVSVKNIIYVKKIYLCSCKTGKYLANIMDDSVITWDEFIDVEAKSNGKETKSVPTKF